ncbi:MAG: DUF1553 domain-containing protein, partial [Planctomycetota bacterium]
KKQGSKLEVVSSRMHCLNVGDLQPAKLARKVPAKFRKDPDQADIGSLSDNQRQALEAFRPASQAVEDIKQEIADTTEKCDALGAPQYCLGVQDADQARDANVLLRGEKNKQGDRVPRGFLSALERTIAASDSLSSQIDDGQSGRLQLAQWLTDAENPLTPRVAVNRIWQHVMGKGLVATADNFGTNGQSPTHPELLDYLADQFVHQHAWSQKNLIRSLVLSRTYRQSSKFCSTGYAADPANRLYWRMDRRRLEAEAIRDAILAVSGLLTTEPLSGSLVMEIGEGEVGRNLDTAVLDRPFHHRAVYLPIIRGLLPEELQLFDFPEPSNVQGRRDSNTTAKQSLFLMNSPLMVRASQHFAESLLTSNDHISDRQRVIAASQRCFGRSPTAQQIRLALEFIAQMTASSNQDNGRLHAWQVYCQTLIASAPFRYID